MSKFAAAAPDLGSLHLNDAASASVGALALLTAAGLWLVGKRVEGRPLLPRVEVLLVLAGTSGIVLTPVGSWLRAIVTWINRLIAAITHKFGFDQAPWFGAALIGLIALIALFALVMDLKGRNVDVWTFVLAVVVALTVQSIPGTVGRAALTAVTAVTAVVDWPFVAAMTA